MNDAGDAVDTSDLLDDGEDRTTRKWTIVFVLPFLLIGLADLLLLLFWGLDPLWGFMIFPPILFMSVLTWIAFRTGFASDRTDG